jgi:hypothetical protein
MFILENIFSPELKTSLSGNAGMMACCKYVNEASETSRLLPSQVEVFSFMELGILSYMNHTVLFVALFMLIKTHKIHSSDRRKIVFLSEGMLLNSKLE